MPRDHVASVIGDERAGWIRCRIIEREDDVPKYKFPPLVRDASAVTLGAVAHALHARTVEDEVLGLSEGVPGQAFALQEGPVVDDGEPFLVEVGNGRGWEEWVEVDTFAGSGADARHVMVDRARATVVFPPAVREPDGSLRHYGATPPKGAPLRVPRYRVGGGHGGNVAAGTLSVLRSTVPFVSRAVNRAAAHDGTDGETIEEAKVRGPLALRTRDRAVTLEDYEQLAKRAAPGVARTHAVAETGDVLGVRLLVVPTAAIADDGRVAYSDLIPAPELLGAISEDLEPRRLAGTRLLIEPPEYQGVKVVARLRARPRVAVDRLEGRCPRRALPSLRSRSRRGLRRRLAVRPAGARGRGVLGAAVAARHRARRRGAAVRGRSRHRQARRARAADRHRPERARLQPRARPARVGGGVTCAASSRTC